MQITDAALDLLQTIQAPGPRTVLSVGSGPDELERWKEEGYSVIRLDIEPKTNPDILASMTDMGDIGPYDAVFCCHALEHLYPHEVVPALKEFYRVLRTGGMAVVMVPDLEDVKPTEEVLPEIGMSGLHLYYGDAQQIADGFTYMAHHCGFVKQTLARAFEVAGFRLIHVERLTHYNLSAIGVKA